MQSGFVSLIGRPNVGKSTLLNSIVGKKVAITSDKPQTTRNIIQGIYNEEDTQIVFVDTPGIHKPNHKLGKYLNKQAYYSIDDVDIVLMLVDASQPLGPGDNFIIERLQNVDKPVILIINKIDKLTRDELMEKIVEYKEIYNCKEIIREKVFELTEEEVPHSLTCYIEHVEKNKNNNYVLNGVIVVDRDSLKSIIIGKQGRMIKEIGMRARKDMEELLGRKVYLELYVKVIKKWRDRENSLSEFGFNEFE